MLKTIVKSGVAVAVLTGTTLMFAGPAFADSPAAAPVAIQTAGHTGKVDPAAVAYGFGTLNLTGYTMTEVSHSIDGQFNGPEPYDHTVTQPGWASTWGIVIWPGSDTAEIRYQLDDAAHTEFSVVSSDGNGGLDIAIDPSQTDSGFDRLYTATEVDRTDGSVWLSIQTKGTRVHTLTGDQAQQQYEVLKTLGHGGDVHYAFTPTGFQHNVLSAPQVASAIVENDNDPEPSSNSVATSDSVATTSTWSVSATVGVDIAGLVQAEASASYGQSYTADHTVTDTVGMLVPQGQAGWITAQNAVDRVTGNFTITIGSDTWNLQGVSFDVPLAGKTPIYHTVLAPIGSPNIPTIVRH